MGDNHCWKLLGRTLCVATAFAVLAAALCEVPAFAAEDYTEQADGAAAYTQADGASSVADTAGSYDAAEPLSSTTPAAGDAGGPLNSTETPAGSADEPLSLSETDVSEEGTARNDTVLPAGGDDAPFGGLLLLDSNEIYDLVLSIKRNRRYLSETSIGLQKNDKIYLPMVEIGRLVRFKVDANLENETISGFFITAENTFSLDNKAGTYTVRGEEREIPPDSVIVRDLGQGFGDFYVTPELLNDIWPLDLIVDIGGLAVEITTIKSLPRDLENEREEKRNRQNTAEDPYQGLNLKYVANDYRLLSLPIVNISNSLQWRDKSDTLTNSISVSGKNDILGTSASYNINTVLQPDDTPEITSARMRFTRQDLGGGELPLGLKKVEFGDVITRPSDLIDRSVAGRGVLFTNEGKRKDKSFDEITIEGTGQAGWEIELYNGSRLLEFGFIDERGEYRFDNVPLSFGENTIRVVLYGPEGQIEERVETYRIDGNMLKPGETTFSASALEANRDFIRVDDDNDSLPQGGTYNVRVDRGINRRVTAFSTITHMPTSEDTDETYATAGATVAALGGVGQIEGYKQIGGGEAVDLRYANKFRDFRYNLRTSFFRDFTSEEAGFDLRNKTFEAEARVNTRIKTGFVPSIGLNFDYLYEKYKDDSTSTRLRASETTSIKNFRISHSNTTNLDNGEHTNTQGTLNINTRITPKWRLRTLLNYEVFPDAGLDEANLELRYFDKRNSRLTGAFEVARNLETKRDRFGVNAAYDFGTFLGGVDLDWIEDEGLRFGLRLNTSFAPYGVNNKYIASSTNLSGDTPVKSRVFLDNDLDGFYSPGDEPIPDAQIMVGQQTFKKNSADEDGMISIVGAGQEGPANMKVNTDSLPDPFMVPSIDGYSTALRPVVPTPFYDFPVILSGVIDGTAYFANGEPLPGLTVQLVDADGEVVKETATMYDGFYIFEYVKPGTYTVQASPSHEVYVPTKTVMVTSADLLVYGVDLRISDAGQAVEVPAADESDGESGRVAQLHHAPAAGGTYQPAPNSSDGGFQAVVRAVRIGEHPHKVRLVLDLSAPADYSLTSEDGGQIINIDLPSTAWDAERFHDLSKHPVFSQCEVLALDGGTGTRLRLTARTPVEIFYNAALPPENGKSDRIYVDFMKTP